MEYQVKKVAMTGGSGPIGLALIRKLIAEGVEIILFQREQSARRKYLPEHKRLKVIFCDLEQLKDYEPTEHDIDVFFHLGWMYTMRSKRDDMKAQSSNVSCACDAVELARKMGCHTFIGAGSQAEYGRHNEAMSEDTLCTPESAYGVMKLSACHATNVLCKRYGMRHIWPRILSGYGIWGGPGAIIEGTIQKWIEGQKIEFSEGKQIWDFCYLDDIANALYLIAKAGKDGAKYPVGSGQARPLREYLEILCKRLGNLEEVKFGAIPYMEGQIMHLEADIKSLQEDTGWMPQVSFEEGIERTIEFYKMWNEVWKGKTS